MLKSTPLIQLAFLACSVLADENPGPAEQYAKVVSAEPELVAYWPFDGDCTDAKGNADGQPRPKGSQPQFGDGPGGGKALVLQQGRFVTMGNTPGLDLPETTLELWFQADFKPGVGYNPCIIAKRASGDHRNTRFSVHLWNDYSCLAVWNGRQVIRYNAPEGPLRRGQWYHLAVTCTAEQMQAYLDGVPCLLSDSRSVFSFDQTGLPLSVGSSTPAGQELLDCRLDEVAVYRKALSPADLARHVDAMGFKQRRLQREAALRERAEREKKLQAERRARHAKQLARRMSDKALFAPGKPYVYRGEHLAAVNLPLGGIGAGTIQINGKAERAIWQIFNNYPAAQVPNSFFAVYAKAAGGKPVVRALQTSAVGPFRAMDDLSFRGEYPFAWYDFEDAALPVRASLEAFSPLIPMNPKDSAIPCAVFRLTAENTGQRQVEVGFLASQQNAVGFTGAGPIDGRRLAGYGGNRNRVVTDAGATMLHMTAAKPESSPGFGDMALVAVADGVTATASWPDLQALHDDLAADGKLSGAREAGPSDAGETFDGALAAGLTLEAGEKRTVTFVLTWCFPNARHGGWQGWDHAGNMYTNWWSDALEVARYVNRDLDRLLGRTQSYHDAFYAGNLPHWLLDRISSQVAVLRSKTCFWAKDGYFGAWEGCRRGQGCCPGNCSHVWHYAQAHARLFPGIARRMRQQVYALQHPSGALPFRLTPGFGPAADGQLGDVLGAYREHLCSADRKWLQGIWPQVHKAMEHTVAQWDQDEDGVLAGAQHNTLDGELGGSTSWIGSMYLAALEASARMAELQGDARPFGGSLEQTTTDGRARRYRRIWASGAEKQDQTLFNGEYYVQLRDPQPRHDYAEGCTIDQVLGEWWANQLDIPPSYPADHVRTALQSLLRYNFRTDFHGIRQVPRKFVHDDDAGLQMIQWPKGPRPSPTILYGDEIMTGFEYSAAAAMIQYGMLREGFLVAKATDERYDGRLRTGLTPSDHASWGYSGNPFGDDECGKFYARAMSVWSILLACQGFLYDGPAGIIGFRPVWQPEDHASFFTAAEGWGLFRQKRTTGRQSACLELRYGRLCLRELVFELPPDARPARVIVRVDQREAPAEFRPEGNQVRVAPAEPIVLEAGQSLRVEAHYR